MISLLGYDDDDDDYDDDDLTQARSEGVVRQEQNGGTRVSLRYLSHLSSWP